MLSAEEHKALSISSSEDYSLVFTSSSMFIFQDDDYKEVETLERSDSSGAMDEYLRIPKKHQTLEQDILSVTGETTPLFSNPPLSC